MTTKSKLESALKKRIVALWPHTQHAFDVGSVAVEIAYPPEPRFGHYTSNIAMRLSPIAQMPPREIAEKLIDGWRVAGIEKIEIAGPGFLNFSLSVTTLRKQVTAVLTQKHRYGRSEMGKGKRVNVEFISANPTGPLTLGNGRGAFMGDALSRALQKAGYAVTREYYVNDMGNQVNILAESVLRRYWQSQGIQMEYPEYCYQGQYIEEIARSLYLPNYKLGNNSLVEIRDKIKGRILKKMLSDIQRFVKRRLGIAFTKWFSEKTLYTSKKVDRMLDILRSLGLIYEREGAVWLRTQKYGDEKDRVLIRSNGDATYFLPDIAYHYDKLTKRKFHKVINFIGADHAGYAPRMYAAMKALGHEGKLTLIVFQLVRLLSGGQEVRMSKRRGTFVTLEELIDDVGVDAARYFFLMYAFTTHMDFDLDLAKKKSNENPVYYVQYAHARICSILKKAKTLARRQVSTPASQQNSHPSSNKLMVKLVQWPEVVEEVARTYATQKLPTYAHELATIFHDFYTNVRVIDGETVQAGPLALVEATKTVLADVLGVMGISAPQKM